MNPLKSLAKTTLLAAYKYSGCGRIQEQLSHWSGTRFMAVLVFHRVTDAVPEDGLTVGVARFARICRMLRRGFRVVPLAELYRIVRSGQPMPPRTVTITFDDSYRDNLFAARVLKDHGLPACFFVPTGFVGTDRVFDWDRGLPVMANLTWDDVRAMADMGFEIGSHTVTHPNLGIVSDEEARREMVESKAAIEREISRQVRWFAYPFGGVGDFRPALLPVLEEAGYEGCLSAHGGLVYPDADPRMLPREPAPGFDGVLNMELHLSGSLNWFYAVKRRLGLLRPAPEPMYLNPAHPTRA